MKKIYTMSYRTNSSMNNVPFLRLSGKWLEKIGFHIGDKLQMIESQNMIILCKMPQQDLDNLKILSLQKQIQNIKNKQKSI